MGKGKRGSTQESERAQVKPDLSKKNSVSSSAPSVNAPFNMRGERKGVLI